MNSLSQNTIPFKCSLREKSRAFIFFQIYIIIKLLQDISTVSATCFASNCDICDTNSSTCKVCTNPFSINNFGYCDSSRVCEFNQFYRNDINKCDSSCPIGFKENSVLNVCEKLNTCSKNINIGNKYLNTDFNVSLFSDLSQQIYIQCSSSEIVNIYDAKTLQFQAQIVSSMKIVNRQVYNPFDQNLVLTNKLGEIEVWNVLTTNLIYKSKVVTFDGSNIFYVAGAQLFFYLNNQRYLTVIEDFSLSPKVLPYYINSTDFIYAYVENPKSVVFSGNQQELLHIAIDTTYSLIYWNKFNISIKTDPYDLFRPTLFPSFIMLYKLSISPLDTIIYYPATQKWIRTYKINPQTVGLFIDKISIKNSTHIQLYDLDVDGKLIPLGQGYKIQFNLFVVYDKNTKCFGLTISGQSLQSQFRFDIDLSPDKKYQDGMISNIVSFSFQILNFILLDDVNRRLIVRSAGGNIYVIDIDTLKTVYNIKQFQQPFLAVSDTINMISSRVDTSNQSNLLSITLFSAQSINIYDNKKKFRSLNQQTNFVNFGVTKDFALTQPYQSQFIIVFKLSNMQKVNYLNYTSFDNIIKCSNPIFSVSSMSNDFITACKSKIVYQSYNNDVFTNNQMYTLKNLVYTIKELQNHLIVCYLVECYYHAKQTIENEILFLRNINGVMGINARNNQPYFQILSNTSYVLFYDYETWTMQQNFTLPSSCYSLQATGFIEGNRGIFACKPDSVSLSTVFFILKLITSPIKEVSCNTLKIDRIFTFIYFSENSNFYTVYVSGVKLYIYMYSFTSDLQQILEKAQNVIASSSITPAPYWDPVLRRLFLSYNNMIYSNFKYIGENRYYDILESTNTNEILKFKRCFYNSYVIGILKNKTIHISDQMHKLSYNKVVSDVTDIFIDSTQDTVFYLVNNSFILYRYNYVLDLTYTFTNSVQMTDFTSFTQPSFSNIFTINNRVNLEFTVCQYTNQPIDIKCFIYKINPKQSQQYIQTVTCFQNAVYVLDSTQFSNYFLVDPTKNSNQIKLVVSYQSKFQIMKVYPNVSLLVTQTFDFHDGLISNVFGAQVARLGINSEVIDVIAVYNDYFFVCSKMLYRLTKNFINTSTISTNMIIKKVFFYQKKNIILIISSQRQYQNQISFYDIQIQLQLQSIEVGLNPLEDLIYLEEEDIFVTYNLYGQIFRIDLNKSDQEDYIVNQFEADTGSLMNNYFPKIFLSRVLNIMIFANQNTVHKWNYSPFIGERLNFRRIRYQTFHAVQHTKNLDIIYYSDIQGFIWSFNSSLQKLLIQSQTEIVDLFITPDYFVSLSLTNILVYQINDYSNTLLNNITLSTTTIQMSMKFRQQLFAYITHDFDFYLIDLTTNPSKAQPNKIASLSTTPQDFILISDDTVIISLLNSNPVKYKVGDTQFTVLKQFPVLKTLIGFQLLTSEQNIILIEEKNIIKFNPSTFAIISQLNFYDLDTAGIIESYAFDNRLNVIYIHYLTENYIQIIPYTLNKSDITYVGSCDIYQVKFLIQDKYVAIYCIFQINFHSRESTKLKYMYSFRKPTIVKSMMNLLILNDMYLIITQTDTIMIFSMTPVIQGTRQFTLYRTIGIIRAQIFQYLMNDENNIKVTGVGYDGYFNNEIVFNSSCENKFTSIKNKLNLKSQLNKININEENIQKYYYFEIQLDSSVQFTNLPFTDEMIFKNNNALIEFVPQTSGQSLILNNSIFQAVSVYDLMIEDFTLEIPKDNNNIEFNPSTQTVIFKKISITSNLKNVSFIFKNIKKVIIDKLTISDITLTDCILFQVKNVQTFYITNLNIINTKFVRSQILNANQSNNIKFQFLQLISLKVLEYNDLMLFNVKDSDSFKINTFLFRDIIGIDISTSADRSTDNEIFERDSTYLSQQLNHIIYLQKIKLVDISSGSCISLKKISFLKIEDLYIDGINLQKLEYSLFKMSSIDFIQNIGMNSLVFIQVSDIVLKYITASVNHCSDCNGSVFFTKESSVIDIQNSIFESNKAIHGGSIAHISCSKHINNGNNNTYTQNSARGNGGAIYLEECDMIMNSVSFIQNTALIGGAIRYKELVPLFIQNVNDKKFITFKENKAQIYGKNYGSYFGKIALENFENSVVLGQYSASNFTFQQFFIDNFSSGDDIELFVNILDEEQDIIQFNSTIISASQKIPKSIKSEFQKIILTLVSQNDEILIDGTNYATYQQFSLESSFIFPANKLIAQPNKTGSLILQTNDDFEIPDYYLNKLSSEQAQENKRQRNLEQLTQTINRNQFQISIHFKFRDCIVGEIFQNISDSKTSCLRCPLGSYSLEQPNYYKKQECLVCSQINTKECGNSTILLQDGYWRLNNVSDAIVECVNKKENCKDQINSIGYCTKGFIGPLCEQCDILGLVWGQPYSQTLDFQCAPCTKFFDTYARWIFIFIGVNIYILGTLFLFFQIYRQKSIIYYLRLSGIISFGSSASRDQSSTYLKFLINYAQLQSNINQFKYEIFILSFPKVFGEPVSQLNTATDCQVVAYQNKLLVKTTAMLCLPILFYLWICIVYLLKSIFTKRVDGYWYLSRKKLFTLFLFSFTVFQPNIVSFLIQSLSCRVIGTKKYVTSDITMECYNEEHKYVIIFACIGIFFWVVIVPYYIYRQIKQITHTEWITVQYCYGFFYLEFKKKMIHWEIVRLYLKLFVVIFVNLLRNSPITQFTCLSITVFTYYHLVHTHSPYETLHMNKIDKQIIISLSIQIILNAVLKDIDLFSLTHVVVLFVIISINISTFAFLVCVILSQKITFISQNLIKFKYKLLQIRCLSNCRFLQVADEIDTNFKRFQNWKKLSSNLQYSIAQCQRAKYQQLREKCIQKSEQVRGLSGITANNRSTDQQYKKESDGFDMMYRELDSITVKRGVNSSSQNGLKAQGKKYITSKSFNNGDQTNALMDGDQLNLKRINQTNLIKDNLTEDKTRMISKEYNQSSIHNLNYQFSKSIVSKLSLTNSPLLNYNSSSNTLILQTNKTSPLQIMQNGLTGKSLYTIGSTIDNTPFNQNENNTLQQFSVSNINNFSNFRAFSNNLISQHPSQYQISSQQLDNPSITNNEDISFNDLIDQKHQIRNNTSIIYHHTLKEQQEEYEEKSKYNTLGLKSYNSQIHPKVLPDENNNSQQPHHPRDNSSSNSSDAEIDEDNMTFNQKFDESVKDGNLKSLDYPIDRYSTPTDLLTRVDKR